MNDRMFETNFKSSHMIAVDDIGTTREMTLLGMLSNTGCLRMKDICLLYTSDAADE